LDARSARAYNVQGNGIQRRAPARGHFGLGDFVGGMSASCLNGQLDPPAIRLLAASPGGQDAVFQSILLFGGLLLVLALGVAVLAYARRRLREDRPASEDGLTLDELRGLRDSGRLTIDEYERLRKRVLERVASGGDAETAR